MIGLDTNVLVRYIMQDDVRQSPLATLLVESLSPQMPGFVALVTIVELAWVLSSAYQLDRSEIVEAFEALLRTKELIVDQAETVWKALRVFQGTNADFADCLIVRSASTAGCEKTMTFDRGAVKACGMVLVA